MGKVYDRFLLKDIVFDYVNWAQVVHRNQSQSG